MKKIFLTIALAVSLFSSEYIVDQKYSSIKFEASKMLFVGVDGEFSNFFGRLNVIGGKLSNIDGTISINSINTKNTERDDHLKADDYFHMIKFPNVKFKSNEIINDIVKANITIKGITKEHTFKISNLSISNKNVSFKLTSTVDRQEFMLNGSMSAIMADNVDVIANIVANKNN